MLVNKELGLKHHVLPILATLMILGNGALILITLRYKCLRTVTNMFIGSLALSDLLVGVVIVPLVVLAEQGQLGHSAYTCLAVFCMTIAQLLVSCLTLTAIAVERFIAVVCPLRHHTLSTTRNAFLVIGFCWVYAMLVGSLPLFGWNVIKGYNKAEIEEWPSHVNGIDTSSSVSFLVDVPVDADDVVATVSDDAATSSGTSPESPLPVFECRYDTVVGGSFVAFMYPGHFLPLWVVMVIIYGQIYMRSRGHRPHAGVLRTSSSPGLCRTGHQPLTNNIHCQNVRRWSSTRGRFDVDVIVNTGIDRRDEAVGAQPAITSSNRWMPRSSENWRALRILTVLVGYFMFSWLPVVVWYSTLYRGFTIEDVRRVDPVLPAWFYNVSITLAYGNSAVNPFLYGFGNRSIRRCLAQIVHQTLRCILCHRRNQETAAMRPVLVPLATVVRRSRAVNGIALQAEIQHVEADRAGSVVSPTGPGVSSSCRGACSRTAAAGACSSEMQFMDERRVIVVEVQRDSCL